METANQSFPQRKHLQLAWNTFLAYKSAKIDTA
jgi:hypothetical protein